MSTGNIMLLLTLNGLVCHPWWSSNALILVCLTKTGLAMQGSLRFVCNLCDSTYFFYFLVMDWSCSSITICRMAKKNAHKARLEQLLPSQ